MGQATLPEARPQGPWDGEGRAGGRPQGDSHQPPTPKCETQGLPREGPEPHDTHAGGARTDSLLSPPPQNRAVPNAHDHSRNTQTVNTTVCPTTLQRVRAQSRLRRYGGPTGRSGRRPSATPSASRGAAVRTPAASQGRGARTARAPAKRRPIVPAPAPRVTPHGLANPAAWQPSVACNASSRREGLPVDCQGERK